MVAYPNLYLQVASSLTMLCFWFVLLSRSYVPINDCTMYFNYDLELWISHFRWSLGNDQPYIVCYRKIFVSGDGNSGIFQCPQGFYCPPGTGNDHKPCPRGSYSNKLGLSAERECTPCDAGQFCGQWNLTSPSGNCSGGYYCISGSDSATPQLTNLTHCPSTFNHLSIGGKCPRGHYCPIASKTKHGMWLHICIATFGI